MSENPLQALELVSFWREAGEQRWFAKDDVFDAAFRERFAAQHEAAARGELSQWAAVPLGALALVLLLDQYPRNSFRDSQRMYATDALAREFARAAIAAGHDQAIEPRLRPFFYLPFGHSEDPADQDYSVSLFARLGGEGVKHAEGHRDIIRRFGRFPHRNSILGRVTTPEEQEYLDGGGFKG
ncbi:MAG: DUF924 family protein [Hyphomicrobiaceae bacterium]|nr:MAG: DUF924 family protein [Hyphomicrobiaceae bacterium]